MNKGWFIPAIIAGAAACSIGFWVYLNTSTEQIAARYSRIPQRPPHSSIKTRRASDAAPQKIDDRPTRPPELPEATIVAAPVDAANIPASLPHIAASPRLVNDAHATRTADSPSVVIKGAVSAALTARELSNDDASPKILTDSNIAPQNDLNERRRQFQLLRAGIKNRALNVIDRLDFTLMEIDRHALRWRNNLSRDPGFVTFCAWIQYLADDIDGADRSFKRALTLRPDHRGALRGRAIAMLHAGRYAQAADAFRALCDADPQDVEARYNLGVLFTRAGWFGEAKDSYQSAISIDPDHAGSVYNLAAIAQRDGRLSDARRYWLRFTELETNMISVWFNLGVVQMDFKEPLEAAAYFRAAVSINPDEIVSRVNLAMAYLEAAHIEEAERVLREVEADAPCEPAVMDALVETNRRLADWSSSHRYEFLARAREIEAELFEMRPPDIEFEQVAGDPMNSETSGLIGP